MARPRRSRSFSLFTLVVASCGLGSSGLGLAQDVDGMRRCRAISDPSARLACYDALVQSPAIAPAPAPSTPTPAARTPAAAAPLPVASPGPVARPEVVGTPERSFGLEHQASSERTDRVVSHIPGTFHGWRPNSEIHLANGQVWQVVDGSTMASIWDNPKVSVRRGVLGSFYLDIEGESRSARVRRIK